MYMYLHNMQQNLDESTASLCHGKLMPGSISPCHPVEKLTFDVTEESAGSNPEQVWLCPIIAQLFFHHGHPGQGVLGTTYPSGWLEANLK